MIACRLAINAKLNTSVQARRIFQNKDPRVSLSPEIRIGRNRNPVYQLNRHFSLLHVDSAYPGNRLAAPSGIETKDAGIIAPIMQPAGLHEMDKALVVLAIAAGSSILSHVNDSGFWLVGKYLGLSEKQTLGS
jgi:hypothetical protein